MKTRLFLSFPSAFPKLSFSYRLPFRVQRYSCNITADLNRCYNFVKKWVNIKFHVYESRLFLCASQLCFCVLPSFIILCFSALLLSSSLALIALFLGLNR